MHFKYCPSSWFPLCKPSSISLHPRSLRMLLHPHPFHSHLTTLASFYNRVGLSDTLPLVSDKTTLCYICSYVKSSSILTAVCGNNNPDYFYIIICGKFSILESFSICMNSSSAATLFLSSSLGLTVRDSNNNLSVPL